MVRILLMQINDLLVFQRNLEFDLHVNPLLQYEWLQQFQAF